MNFEKMTLVRLMRHKDVKLLTALDQKMFNRPSNKVLFKAIKSYYHKHGRIPDVDTLSEAIKVQLPADKAETYIGLLEGFEAFDGEILESNEIRKNLQEAYVIKTVETNLEKLVEASKERDIANVRLILNTLQSATLSNNKTPENMLVVDYEPSKIRIIDACMASMRDNGLKMGGLVLVGAGSGAGKSVFTLQQLMYSFSVDDISCALLNMELSVDESIARMYSHATGEDFANVYGNTDPQVVAKVNNWKQRYFAKENAEFRIKSIRYSMQEIEQTIRQQAAEGIILFGVDYLQIADFDSGGEEWQQLRDLVRMLHQLTQELQIVIVSPVQINFSDTQVKDNEIKVTVRGSKELEFSSSVFLFIYQSPEEYKEDIARIFTIKARNARKNTYMVSTDFKHMVFSDTGVVM